MTTVAEKPDVRRANAEDEFEITLPEGIEELESAAEGAEVEDGAAEAGDKGSKPAAEAKPAEAKPKPEAAAKPAAEKKDGLPPAAREERTKRKEYAKKWEQVSAERDAAIAELNARKAAAAAGTHQKASKEHTDNLIKKANEAGSMGEVLQIALEEQGRRDQIWAARVAEVEFNHRVSMSEMRARIRHKDYDERLTEAGIFDALKTDQEGNFADLALARKVLLARDPGQAAYELAIGKLVAEGKLTDEEVAEHRAEQEQAARREAAEQEAGEKEQPAAEARREGAREVIDTMSRNSRRPRGLNAVQPAGPPKQRITFADLDELSEKDPARLEAIFKANPGLEERWLGG